MEIGRYKPGDVLHLRDGAKAEVLAPSEDAQRIRARYLAVGDDTALVGTEALIDEHEVLGFAPAAPDRQWGDRVSVVLNHLPESEEGEEGYEAVALDGLPLGVSVQASDADTAREALDRLLGALAVFGYTGTVAVRDLTQSGSPDRYEVEIGADGTAHSNH